MSLERLARRVSTDPLFFASVIAAYQKQHNRTDESLAAELRIPVERLTNLRLCGRLRIEDATLFAEDVRQVATKFGCDPRALARIALD
jgi:hypothetical protein